MVYLKLTNLGRGKSRFHLITREETHQKLDTLSSNKPLANGNIRFKTWSINSTDSKKGKKHIARVAMTAIPKNKTVEICLHVASSDNADRSKKKKNAGA